MIVSGCSTVEVEHKMANPTKVEGLQSFAWVEAGGGNSDVRVKNPMVDKQVRKAVEKELTRKGYSKVGPEAADFFVSWFGKVNDEVKEQSISHFYRSYGYGALAGSMEGKVAEGAVKQTYKKGTLVLDILDSKSKQLIWRGIGKDTIVEGMSDQEIGAYINKSVRAIIDNFPVR